MKFLFILSMLLVFLSCKKDVEDKNPVITFTPFSNFTYTNQDTVLLQVSSISTRPIEKVVISLVVDELGKDSVMTEFLGGDLEVFNLVDTLLLDVNWEDSLLMRLKVSSVDGSQTNTHYREVLFIQHVVDTLN